MKRLQIYIEEDLDQALAGEARRRRTSRAAIIREYVGERLRNRGPDPVDEFIGSFSADRDLSTMVDDIVYGSG